MLRARSKSARVARIRRGRRRGDGEREVELALLRNAHVLAHQPFGASPSPGIRAGLRVGGRRELRRAAPPRPRSRSSSAGRSAAASGRATGSRPPSSLRAAPTRCAWAGPNRRGSSSRCASARAMRSLQAHRGGLAGLGARLLGDELAPRRARSSPPALRRAACAGASARASAAAAQGSIRCEHHVRFGSHALDQVIPHRVRRFLVRGAILSPAAVRLSRPGRRHRLARALQGDGAQALSRHHDAGDGAYARQRRCGCGSGTASPAAGCTPSSRCVALLVAYHFWLGALRARLRARRQSPHARLLSLGERGCRWYCCWWRSWSWWS